MARPLPPSLRSTSLAADGLRRPRPRAPAPPRRAVVDVLRPPFRCDEKSTHQLVSELADLRERHYGSAYDVKNGVATSDLKQKAGRVPNWSDHRKMLTEIRGSHSPRVETSPPRVEPIHNKLDEIIQLQQEVIREQRQMAALRNVLLTELQGFVYDLKSSRNASPALEASQRGIELSEVENQHDLLSETTNLNLPQLLSDASLSSPSDFGNSHLHQQLQACSVRSSDSTTEEAYGISSASKPLQDPTALTLSVTPYPEKLLDSEVAKNIALVQDVEMNSISGPIISGVTIPMKMHVSFLMKFPCERYFSRASVLEVRKILCSNRQNLVQSTPYTITPVTYASYLIKCLNQLSDQFSDGMDKFAWICEIPPHPPPGLLLPVFTSRNEVAFGTTNIAREVTPYFNGMNAGDQRGIANRIDYMHQVCFLTVNSNKPRNYMDTQEEVTVKIKANKKSQKEMTTSDTHIVLGAKSLTKVTDAVCCGRIVYIYIKEISLNVVAVNGTEEEISAHNSAVKVKRHAMFYSLWYRVLACHGGQR